MKVNEILNVFKQSEYFRHATEYEETDNGIKFKINTTSIYINDNLVQAIHYCDGFAIAVSGDEIEYKNGAIQFKVEGRFAGNLVMI